MAGQKGPAAARLLSPEKSGLKIVVWVVFKPWSILNLALVQTGLHSHQSTQQRLLKAALGPIEIVAVPQAQETQEALSKPVLEFMVRILVSWASTRNIEPFFFLYCTSEQQPNNNQTNKPQNLYRITG